MNEFNNRKQQNGETKRLKCPSCNSTNLQYVTETETKVETSGYSGSRWIPGLSFLRTIWTALRKLRKIPENDGYR